MAGAAQVDLVVYSDADYSQAFRYQTGYDDIAQKAIYYDFTGCTMQMMVRTSADDTQVYLDINSTTLGFVADQTGIDIYDPGDSNALPEPAMIEFSLNIGHSDLQQFLPEAAYVQSLIVTSPNGVKWDLWRGNLTSYEGPTR
jgi:hypothetical protein